jgi:hypothetical protein
LIKRKKGNQEILNLTVSELTDAINRKIPPLGINFPVISKFARRVLDIGAKKP